MAQYALMVWGPSEYGEFGTYASAEENAAQLRRLHRQAPGRAPRLRERPGEASSACRRKIEVRPMGGE